MVRITGTSCTSFFKSPDLKLKDTVLSKDALIEHINRSAYRAGWLWRESFDNAVLPGPELWGWKPYFELCTNYFPRWQQEDSQTTIQDVVSTCGCKTSNCVNCKCELLGKNVWTSANVRENVKISETFYTVLDLSYVIMFFPDLIVPYHIYLQYFFSALEVCKQ